MAAVVLPIEQIVPIQGPEALENYSELCGSASPERVPRDWSKAVAAYSAWLASGGKESGALARDLNGAAQHRTDGPIPSLLELFIDTEQRRTLWPLIFH